MLPTGQTQLDAEAKRTLGLYFIQVDFLEYTVEKDQELNMQREIDLTQSSSL